MRQRHGMLLAVFTLSAFGLLGCGKTTGPANDSTAPQAASENVAAASVDRPETATAKFLEALRSGNDNKATAMLSEIARKELAKIGRSVMPPASDTARFEVGEVKPVAKDGAQVAFTWTDLDENGKPQSNPAWCVMRRESNGWRVVGLALTVFDGEPPLLLNFENPAEVLEETGVASPGTRPPQPAGKDPGNQGRKIGWADPAIAAGLDRIL